MSFPPPPLPAGQVNLPRLPSSSPAASSSASESATKPKPKKHRKPYIPPGTPHKHAYLQGRCGNNGCHGKLIPPFWSPAKGKFFVKCSISTCNFFRISGYDIDVDVDVAQAEPAGTAVGAPVAALATAFAAAAASIPTATSKTKCTKVDCATNHNKPVNINCINQMCRQDCIQFGSKICGVYQHKKMQLARIQGSQPVVPQPVVSQPSAPIVLVPATPAASQAVPSIAPPPSQPPMPSASAPPRQPTPLITRPGEQGSDFVRIRRLTYAREFPTEEWAAQVIRQRAEMAERMQMAARFRQETREGTTVYVVFWMEDAELPLMFERVVDLSRDYYRLTEDHDVCQAAGIKPTEPFVGAYKDGLWFLRSPDTAVPITAGIWLFFRDRKVTNTARLDDLLALAKASEDHQECPASSSTSMALLEPTLPSPLHSRLPTPSPSASSITPQTAVNPTPPRSPSPTSTLISLASSSATTPGTREWPWEFTVKEIHDGLTRIQNAPKMRKGEGTVPKCFARVWPEQKYKVNAYYDAANIHRLVCTTEPFQKWVNHHSSPTWADYLHSHGLVKGKNVKMIISKLEAAAAVKTTSNKGKQREEPIFVDDDEPMTA